MPDRKALERPPLFPLIMVIIIAVIGIWTAVFGAWLAVLGGSLYYVIAGIGLIVSAWLLYRGSAAALWVYAIVLAGTLIWALVEVGLDFWQLSPRGNLLVPVAIVLLVPWLTRWLRPRTSAIRGAGIALSAALLASIGVLVVALLLGSARATAAIAAIATAGAVLRPIGSRIIACGFAPLSNNCSATRKR